MSNGQPNRYRCDTVGFLWQRALRNLQPDMSAEEPMLLGEAKTRRAGA